MFKLNLSKNKKKAIASIACSAITCAGITYLTYSAVKSKKDLAAAEARIAELEAELAELQKVEENTDDPQPVEVPVPEDEFKKK